MLLPRCALAAAFLLCTFPAVAATPAQAIDAELTRLFPATVPGAAVLVVKDGVTVLNKGYGLANVELHVPMRADQVLHVASVSKQFTAAGILKLEEAGKLSVDDPIRRFFPGAPATWDGITVAHLLHHTSGIPNLQRNPAFRAQLFDPHTPAQLLQQAQSTPLLAPPGTAFSYATVNYSLLAMIIEQVMGAPYEAYLARQFFIPLGMAHTTPVDDATLIDGVATPYEPGPRLAVRWHSTFSFGGGSYASTTADLLRWTMALQGGRVLQPASLRAMNTALTLPDGQRLPYGDGLRPHTLAGQPYIQSNGDKRGFHAEVVYLPAARVFVAMLTNGEGVLRYGPAPVVKRIATIAAGMPQHAAVARPLPADVLQQRAGVYVNGSARYIFHVKDGRLLVEHPVGTPWAPLSPLSPTEFFYDAHSDFRIRFLTTDDGKPAMQWCEMDPLDGDTDPVFTRDVASN